MKKLQEQKREKETKVIEGGKKKKKKKRIKHKTLASKCFLWILFRVKDLGFRVAEFAD